MKTATLSTSRLETLASDLAELVKARLSFLVLLTTLVGFLMGWQGPMSYLILAGTLVGTALCACGASALNQWWERDFDARMKRTQQRPLPAKRMHPNDALLFGLLFSVSGLAVLLLFTNIRAALLAFITIAIYVLVYTPMKRISSLNTLVGAIPGALPPADRLGGRRRTLHARGRPALRDPLVLADAALSRDRLDVSRRLCRERVS